MAETEDDEAILCEEAIEEVRTILSAYPQSVTLCVLMALVGETCNLPEETVLALLDAVLECMEEV